MESNSPRRRVLALVVTLFILGIALGASSTYLVLGRRAAVAAGDGLHGRHTRAEAENQLNQYLSLSGDQKAQVDKILDSAHERFHSLDQQVEPQYDSIRQDARNQIRAILTPQQTSRFEELTRQWDNDRKKQMQQ